MSGFRQRATVRLGKLIPETPGVWAAGVQPFEGKTITVVFETEQKRRTNDQNAYLHAVIIPFFQEQWSKARRYPHGLPPYSKDEVRAILADACFGTEESPIPGTREHKRTKDLNTAQFTKLIDFCRGLAWDMYEAVLPAPGEPWEVSA